MKINPLGGCFGQFAIFVVLCIGGLLAMSKGGSDDTENRNSKERTEVPTKNNEGGGLFKRVTNLVSGSDDTPENNDRTESPNISYERTSNTPENRERTSNPDPWTAPSSKEGNDDALTLQQYYYFIVNELNHKPELQRTTLNALRDVHHPELFYQKGPCKGQPTFEHCD